MKYLTIILMVLMCGCVTPMHETKPTTKFADRNNNPHQLMNARQVILDIGYLNDNKPSIKVLQDTIEFMKKYIRPAEGFIVYETQIITKTDIIPHSTAKLLKTLNQDKGPLPTGTVKIYVLYVGKRQEALSGRGSRGMSMYDERFIVIAKKAIEEQAKLTISSDDLEAFVFKHEVGHCMGLVTEDYHEYDGHCNNPKCLMYLGADFKFIMEYFKAGELPQDIDGQCKNDLKRIKNGEPVK